MFPREKFRAEDKDLCRRMFVKVLIIIAKGWKLPI